MDVAGILRLKGDRVVTITPGATVAEALELLALHDIGAVVVTADGDRVGGILSERDLVRRWHESRSTGAALPPGELTVAAVCTTDVEVCRLDDDVDEVMRQMTAGRFRHLPVLDADDALTGIVSIGDVVKHRVDELESINQDLRTYVSGTW